MDSVDKYLDKMMNRVNVPPQFRPHIKPVYPPNNEIIFEEWVGLCYEGCNTDRVLLDCNFTSYWVNNNYANDEVAKKAMQDYVDSLDVNKRYFCICQYDDGVLVDWKGKDVLEFNMSKQNGVMIPLICQPHPYKFNTSKKWLASFVGGRTHPIRNELEKLQSKNIYISYEIHDIENYCRIMHESVFTLCPRGYGANSFRTCEALQYGSIPIYISDEFIQCFDTEFLDYGWKVRNDEIDQLGRYLELFERYDTIIEKQDAGKKAYEEYYTFQGCYNNIIKSLEAEYHTRQQK